MKIRDCSVSTAKDGIKVKVTFNIQPNIEEIANALQKGVSSVDYDFGISFVVGGFSDFLDCWNKIVKIFSEMETDREKIKDFLSKQV